MELKDVKKEVARLERENPGKKVAVNVSRVHRIGHSEQINCEITVR